jgi:putative transposase
MLYDPYYHHRRSIRLKGYDYSSEGYYFVTMCSLNRKNLFSYLPVGAGLAPALQQELSNPSLLANKSRPNHINSVSGSNSSSLILTRIGEILDHQWKEIPANYKNVTLDEYVIMPNHFHGIIVIGTVPNELCSITLGSILGSFKSLCVNNNLNYIKEQKLNEKGKIWQRDYFDHIIRNKRELDRIRIYIKTNPYKWLKDTKNRE